MEKQVITLQEENCDMPIETAYQTFRRGKVNNNLAKATVANYDVTMKLFTEFLNGRKSCQDLTRDIIDEFIEFLKTRNPDIKATSINSYLRELRVIIYYFAERGYLKRFPIKMIKEDAEIKETYTSEEIDLLLKKPDLKKADFSEYRNWVITCYLLATGNRLGTVCELRVKDIDFDSNGIHLRKLKTRKAYNIPLSSELGKSSVNICNTAKAEMKITYSAINTEPDYRKAL